jgi:biopolymer transport protein ExbB
MRQHALHRARWAQFGSLAAFLIACHVLLATALTAPHAALAQEAKEEEVVDLDAAVEKAEAKIDEAGGGELEPEAPLDEEPPPDQEPDETTEQEVPSYLDVARSALGWQYGLIFLGLSFTLVALLVMNLLTARRENVCPAALIDSFEQHLDEKQYQEAYELAKNDDSFLGQVLSAGLAKLSSGYPQAIEAMHEVGEEENMKLEHRLSYMALIGTISPMVGLFGTVQGMIASFRVIAQTTGTPPPSDLARGISTALYTTLIGLGIAIPAIAAFNILKNRVARLVLEVGIVSEGLMSRFENVGPRKK